MDTVCQNKCQIIINCIDKEILFVKSENSIVCIVNFPFLNVNKQVV